MYIERRGQEVIPESIEGYEFKQLKNRFQKLHLSA
jgi:hypothetical protein